MSEQGSSREEAERTISFGARFAQSERFRAVFRQGMALVEETAAYLDGDGREEARALKSPISLAYAAESMRLTTRLMQLASWLLVRRAVSEGEITVEEAASDSRRVSLPAAPAATRGASFDALPEKLKNLVWSCDHLMERIVRLDMLMNQSAVESGPSGAPQPLDDARRRLEHAFGKPPRA